MYCFLSTPFIGALLLPWTSTSTLDLGNVGIHTQNVRITNTTYSQKFRQDAFNTAKTKLLTFTINFYFLSKTNRKMNIKCLLLSSQCTLPITGNLVFWAAVTVSTRGWQCHWHCPQASPPFISPDLTRDTISNHIQRPSLCFWPEIELVECPWFHVCVWCVLVTSRKLLIYAQPC